MVLLKLDFRKAYDTISHLFMFKVMEALGIPPCFSQWIRLFFTGAETAVHLNGQATSSFPIQRGVRQGCPLAPYLFFMIGEALNIATKWAMEMGNLQGIHLPEEVEQQLILQYADDTSYTLAGTKENLSNLIALLDLFHLASGLCINWDKNVAYWLAHIPPPPWLALTRCQWAVENQVSKLLGTPFGMDLHTRDVDEFLLTKIQKKLTY
jgi:hypothetical protein